MDNSKLEYRISGNPNGRTLLFIHGWPDDASVWRHQVDALAANYRCVTVTLPNFGDSANRPGGYDFPELIQILDRTIDEIMHGHDEQLVLVTHDWGAYIGYLYETASPDRIRAMVAMDIGGHFQPESISARLMIIGYQWPLVLSWLAGRIAPPLGNWLTRQVARGVKVPARQLADVRARSNYLYYYFWRGMLLPSARANLLNRYRPKCPVLFLYGDRKPVMFHSARWLTMVEQTGGKTICVNGAGHWFMESHPEIVNDAIAQWGISHFS